jgi:hypothetical protein
VIWLCGGGFVADNTFCLFLYLHCVYAIAALSSAGPFAGPPGKCCIQVTAGPVESQPEDELVHLDVLGLDEICKDPDVFGSNTVFELRLKDPILRPPRSRLTWCRHHLAWILLFQLRRFLWLLAPSLRVQGQ